ncbi:uncharacterized protein EAE98_001517 [Botrytis deweyae]|uniref:Cyanovirin-N domain-containing protein n=1 Tax=Botrytis deweyae TaxID=2478750 RepID=A0ABQ7IY26_9HELO|nr:uncharacterized protein EAE98_001517 [Botrytis deweyae]KAF7937203.1 hypothetical protein EAE98_001517 [Botrytis deweyae]
MSPGSFAFNFNRDGTILSSITTIPTGRAVFQQNLAIMEAVAGTLTCVKNDDKVATSNDLIYVCGSLDCSVDESGKFVVSLNCEEGEAGNFSCVSGYHSSGVYSSPEKKKRDGIPKTTNQNATSQASFKTRRGFSFIGGLCEFFTGGSDKCDKFFE